MMETTFDGFRKVNYRQLNARQQEVYNYHHIAALLAQHGYATYPIRDDWNGGDMFANVLDLLVPEPGAFYVMDRGYIDFERLHQRRANRPNR